MPCHIWYDFKKKKFMDAAYGNSTIEWVPIDVTHWMPLPPIPVIEENSEQWKIGIKKAAKLNQKVLKEEIIKMSLPRSKI
jgi:hypothetical protein